ncbi:Y-family DNA polymerase [Candidatus Dojkabacteria bacterium]|nr:Y-family DNA polymerase [Candidatus Dojkabacteria bacterium]
MGNSYICDPQTLKKRIIAVVDCDNFFVSCERVFRPDLNNKPVAVLSNNDGCIVSRSKEVKAMGISMGAPAFKFKELVATHNITLFSSNFSLYGDLSDRVMTILKESVPNTYTYSIDEAFLDFTNLEIKDNDYENFCLNLRKKVKKYTGIPVSIGIAHTKVLAKIASKISKKGAGVLDMTKLTKTQIDKHLINFDVSDIWGIGRKLTPKLQARKICTAYDYKYQDPRMLKKIINILGEQMYLELNGVSCIKLHSLSEPRKNIASTRSFGRNIRNLTELEEAVASYTAIACERLRKQNSVASKLGVYIRTGKFTQQKYYSAFKELRPLYPNSDTRIFTKVAIEGLKQIFKPGYNYAKAGIFLFGIKPLNSIQENLITQNYYTNNLKNLKTMKVMDSINKHWGSGTIKLASEGTKKAWRVKSLLRSSRYTTSWEEIPVIST